MNEWISTKLQLPEVDGTYEIANHDKSICGYASYDGYGFYIYPSYRLVNYWKPYQKLEKKYGKL